MVGQVEVEDLPGLDVVDQVAEVVILEDPGEVSSKGI